MSPRSASVFLFLFMAACAAPGSFRSTEHVPVDGGASPSSATRTALTSPQPIGPQEQDYSLRALYMNAHGDYLHTSEPHRENIRGSFHYQSETDIDGEAGDLKWHAVDVEGMWTLPVDRDVALKLGGNFEVRNYKFDSAFVGIEDDERFYRMDLQLGAQWFIQDDLEVTVMFSPGIYSDLDGGLTHRDWQFFGSALASYKYYDNFFLKGGLIVDETFDKIQTYPAVGFAYIPEKSWRIDVLVPKSATVSFDVNELTTLSAGLEFYGAAYNLRERIGGANVHTENRIQELSLFIEGNHRFTEQVSAFARLGTLLGGDYDLRRPSAVGGDTDGQIGPAVFFEVGMGWTF